MAQAAAAAALTTDAVCSNIDAASSVLLLTQEKRKLSELLSYIPNKRSRIEERAATIPLDNNIITDRREATKSFRDGRPDKAALSSSELSSSELSSSSRNELKDYERLVFDRKLMHLDNNRFKALAKYLVNKLSQWKSRDELRFRALHLPKEIRQKPARRFLKLANHELLAVDTVLSDTACDAKVTEIDGVPLSNKLMACLGPNEWLNDEIINAYMSLLNTRSRTLTSEELTSEQILEKTRPLKCYFWNTFFYPTLTGETSSGRRDGYDYSRVKKWTTRKKLDIFNYDMIFFPLHIHKVHWALGCLDMKSKMVFYFDSLGNDDGNEFFQHIKQYLQDEHLDKKDGPLPAADKWLWAGNNFACSVLTPASILDIDNSSQIAYRRQDTTTCSANIPLQSNGSDCGVFTCQYAECLSISRFPFDFDSNDISFRRKLMVYQLLKGTVM